MRSARIGPGSRSEVGGPARAHPAGPRDAVRTVTDADAGSSRRCPMPRTSSWPRPTARRPGLEGVAPMVLTADCLPIAVAGRGRSGAEDGAARRDAARRLARARRRDRRPRACARSASSAPTARSRRRSARAPAAAATRSATRCARRSPEYGERVRRGRNLDLKAIARDQLERAGRGDRARRRAVHDLLGRGSVLLSPPRSRRHRAAGRARVVELIRGLRAEQVRANLERVRARDRRRRARPGRGADPRGGQVRAGRRARGARRGRDRARRREPRAGSRGQGGGVPRAVHVGLHRPSPEPQGPPGAALRPLHPLGGERVGARAARAPRHPGHGGSDRGQRRRRGGQERDRAGGAAGVPRALRR